MDSQTAVSNILEHHGILGMKWGFRKSRNKGGKAEPRKLPAVAKTGTSRVTGKATIKTVGGIHHEPHPDAIAARVIQQKLAASGSHALSNEEIVRLTNRANLERSLAQVGSPKTPLQDTAQTVKDILDRPETQSALFVARSLTGPKTNHYINKGMRFASYVTALA